ncbi:MAG: divalent metal cation transporter [Saprospiraceae bacterium]|nr:divalent metal cation transporter [Saprospiraceae bacterium]
MPKTISFRQGLSSVLFWSIISAAFIGPGTVTTASNAGADFELSLLWALTFSTIATIVLQEAAARITIASGKSLGEIIALKYSERNQQLRLWLFLAVAFGCAAYQMGNILGAVSGLLFIFTEIPRWLLTLAVAAVGLGFLWMGNVQIIAKTLGGMVALMGLAFCWVAFQTDFKVFEIAKAAFIPSFPENSSLLIIGLIGTTIVPYNLFLASGIGQGQDIREMRIGLTIAILIGGIISAAILFTGTLVGGGYSYEALVNAMATKLGSWAVILFGFGLFAAGMTSCVTAPLAAAITGRTLLGNQGKKWESTGINFRLVWGIVFIIGLFFSLIGIRPIPAIILAQAINGVLLPIVTIFLLLAMNDKQLLPKNFLNKPFSNIFSLIIVGVTCFLGLTNIWKAIGNVISTINEWQANLIWLNLFFSGLIVVLLGIKIFDKEKTS